MSFQARSAILHDIGADLQAGVLAYVTGDRENLEMDVGTDVLRQVPRHLEAIGKQERLALVVYTLGGDANAPWPFVNFLRSYCDELFVLVPFWAHSAGTLIALGADKIYMTRFATLSPIDPSVTNEFNPQDPANPGERIPVAVEDVLAFFQLASEQGADESDLAGDALPQARGLRAPSRPRQREAEHRTDLAAREEAHPAAHAGCRRGGADRPRHAIDDRAVLVSSQTISTSSI